MRRVMIALLVATLGAVPVIPVAAVGSCPTGFHLHPVGAGDHEHDAHRHVGLDMDQADRNANGFICVKHVTPAGDTHVHIDDHIWPGGR
jgi:hypothetical protein